MRVIATIGLLFLLPGNHLHCQDPNNPSDSLTELRVYIECSDCDKDYFSKMLDPGSMTTDPKAADVRIIMIEDPVGSGIAASYTFIGQHRYASLRDTVYFRIPSALSPDRIREVQLEKMQLGLVPYYLKTSEASRLFLFIDDKKIQNTLSKDPWKNWVFDVGGNATMNASQYRNSIDLLTMLYIGKITDKLKIESNSYFQYLEDEYIYFDIDSVKQTLSSYYRNYSNSTLLVKSLGDHWGIGGMLRILNDRPNNLDLRFAMGPAIEYNVFAYKDALQKQFRLLYSVLYEQSNYVEVSIFDQDHYRGYRQTFSILSRFNKEWGYLDASFTATNYLSKPSSYALNGEIFARLWVKKISGLSVNFRSDVNMYRDRIHEAKGFATPEDILMRRKAIGTDYRFSCSIGIAFRFGSRKFSSANPRFRR